VARRRSSWCAGLDLPTLISWTDKELDKALYVRWLDLLCALFRPIYLRFLAFLYALSRPLYMRFLAERPY
jgi:hypothetical protein